MLHICKTIKKTIALYPGSYKDRRKWFFLNLICKGDNTWFAWSPPFDTLFTLGSFINQEGKGQFVVGFIKTLWQNNLAPQLEELIEIARTYCPDLCPVRSLA